MFQKKSGSCQKHFNFTVVQQRSPFNCFDLFHFLFKVVLEAVNKPHNISYKGIADLVTE